MLVITDIQTILFVLSNYEKIFNNNQLIGYLKIIQLIINWKIFEIFALVCSIAGAIATSIIEIFFIICHVHFWQIEQLLMIKNVKKSSSIYNQNNGNGRVGRKCHYRIIKNLDKFRYYNTKNLSLIFEANHCYGRTFFVSIFSLMVFNCYLVIFMVTYHTTLFYEILIIILCAIQFICIFFIHYQFVNINRHFYHSSPILMSRMATTEFAGKYLQTKLKLSNYAQAMYTKNPYGITYWSFQTINMSEFGKVKFDYYIFND